MYPERHGDSVKMAADDYEAVCSVIHRHQEIKTKLQSNVQAFTVIHSLHCTNVSNTVQNTNTMSVHWTQILHLLHINLH
jgi:alkyl hydroperoxide reductase subunit AhpF